MIGFQERNDQKKINLWYQDPDKHLCKCYIHVFILFLQNGKKINMCMIIYISFLLVWANFHIKWFLIFSLSMNITSKNSFRGQTNLDKNMKPKKCLSNLRRHMEKHHTSHKNVWRIGWWMQMDLSQKRKKEEYIYLICSLVLYPNVLLIILQNQVERLRDSLDRSNSDHSSVQQKEMRGQEATRKLQREIRELREEQAEIQRKESEATQKKHELVSWCVIMYMKWNLYIKTAQRRQE